MFHDDSCRHLQISDLEIVPSCTTCRNLNVFVLFFLPPSLLSEELSSSKYGMEEIEQLYLQICCEVSPSITRGSQHPLDTPPADSQSAAVSLLRNKLEQLLLGVADHLLNCYSPDVSQPCCCVGLWWPKICADLIKFFLLTSVSVLSSGVCGPLLQPTHGSPGRLRLYWLSDGGGGLPLAALC